MVITDYAALHIKLNNYNHRRLNGFTRASNRPLNVAYLECRKKHYGGCRHVLIKLHRYG